MSELIVNSEIDSLTAEILILKQQTAENIIEIGKRLIKVQDQLEDTTFKNWLKEKVNFSKSTAYNFMRVAKEFNDVQALGKLGQTKVFALLGVPENEREEFIQEHDIENMSTRELSQAIKERDEAKKQAEDKEKEIQNVLFEKTRLEDKLKSKEELYEVLRKDYCNLKDKHEKEKSKLRKEIENLKAAIDDTQAADPNDEEITSLHELLKEKEEELKKKAEAYQRETKLLQEQLNAPIEATIVEKQVEVIPAEVEKELEELRKKANQPDNEAIAKFKVVFESLKTNFNQLLNTVQEISDADSEMGEKYKRATNKLLEIMADQL